MKLSKDEREKIVWWLWENKGYARTWAHKLSDARLWAIKCNVEKALGRLMPRGYKVSKQECEIYNSGSVAQGTLF